MSLGGTGIQDWLVQRFTAVILAAYIIFLFVFLFNHSTIDFDIWHALFSHPLMKISTLIVLLAVAFHAWIGMWIILTDYVKYLFVRYLLQGIIMLVLFGYVVWGTLILWSN